MCWPVTPLSKDNRCVWMTMRAKVLCQGHRSFCNLWPFHVPVAVNDEERGV